MEIEEEKFKRLREKAERDYEAIGKIRCPYFKEDVHFNTEGFRHLLFKSWNKTRSRTEQYMRLKLLPFAVELIENAHTLQEYDQRKLFVRQKTSSRWCKTLKLVRYYVFTGIFQDKEIRIKVIVKEIAGGAKFFHSVYPSWRVVRDSFGRKKKVFYSGNLELN